MTVSDDKRGGKVRCEECDKSIPVPGDDAIQESGKVVPINKKRRRDLDDDDYSDPTRKPAKSGMGGLLIVFGVVGVLFLFGILCAGVPIGFLMFGFVAHEARPPQMVEAEAPVMEFKPENPEPKVDPMPKIDPNPIPKIDPMPPIIDPNPKPPKVGPDGKGRTKLNAVGALRQTDPILKDPRFRDTNARMRSYLVSLTQDREYVITLDSKAFDPYLILEFKGKKVAEDDDSGGDLNARLVYRAAQTGVYRIVVTAFDGQIGDYRLKVLDISPNPDPIAKNDDPFPKKDDPFPKVDDPLTKKDDPFSKKDDSKKDDPFPKKDDPLTKKDDPFPKKDDPLTKKDDPFPKKDDPLTKKDDATKEPLLKGPFQKPAPSAAATSYLKITSTPGEFIAQGRAYDFQGNQVVITKTPRGVHVAAGGWDLDLGAPVGKTLAVGEYLDARRFPFSGAAPGLEFRGNGRVNKSIVGEFVVWELEMNGTQISRLAIDFVQRSDEKSQPLRGKLRFNSNLE
jgi:hypothetical protein